MDLRHVAAGAEDAAERAGMNVDVPIAIEVRLDLGRPPDGTVLVTNRDVVPKAVSSGTVQNSPAS